MSSARQERTTEQNGGAKGCLCAGVGLYVMVCALVALVLVSPAQAAVFNIAAGDVTALINAINTANGNNEDDTINLAAGTYTLTAIIEDIDGAGIALPLITSTIVMRGAGVNRTIVTLAAGASAFTIMDVHAPGILTLDGLTVTSGEPGIGIYNAGGRVTLFNSSVSDSLLSAIRNPGGSLTLINSSVSRNNFVMEGGAASRTAGY